MPYGGNTTGVSIYNVRCFQRSDNGRLAVPAGTAVATAWAGVRASKARALTVTPAEPQRITARGDGKNYITFLEPPTENPTGELRTQASDIDLIELLTQVTDFGSQYRHMVTISSDKIGSETAVAIWGERKAADSDPTSTTYGQRQWETYFLLNCGVSLRTPPFEDSAIGETVWAVTANNSSTDQYGRAMSEVIHGCTEAAFVLIKTKDRYWVDAFEGDGAQGTFNLTKGANVVYNTATQPVVCCVAGVMRAVSVNASGVATISPTPADGEEIVVEYEYTE